MSKELLKEIDQLRANFLKYTRKAYRMLPRLEKPQILDIGCGSGLPTIELAKLSGGEIIGIDIDQSSLDELNLKIKEKGLQDVILVVGGVFPDQDISKLKEIGAQAVFVAGTPMEKIVNYITSL